MQRCEFNDGWTCRRINDGGSGMPVMIPHDAMLDERRSPDSLGAGNIGWFEGGDYCYEKCFMVPDAWRGSAVVLEFEGVYRNAEVSVNGVPVGGCPYGYGDFIVDISDALNAGSENTITVLARNSDQPNSRWYTGTGIYRPVWLYIGDPERHIAPNGIRVRTVSVDPAEVAVMVDTVGEGEASIEILDVSGTIVATALTGAGEETRIMIPDCAVWDPDHPNLYTCRAVFGDDVETTTFGVRLLAWDAERGLTINNERVILRGACIHHDNGILGACAWPSAEARKVRVLKAAGYNALRSAHNPCSKALLDACDRLGVLVMDEYVDVWYIHKTRYDYASEMPRRWRDDLRSMVNKDYNHPSVVMYSTGNEVSETAQPRGIGLTGEMAQYLHSLDDTRPVTCGINIFFNFLSSIGLGVYTDDKAEREVEQACRRKSSDSGKKKAKPVGSEFYNTMATLLGDKVMKLGATLPPCDWRTKDAYAAMDVAGYNYGILRYRHDLRKYPKRLILGSETFCCDAYAFWEIAKTNPRVIGDFVWAGQTYLGECGQGGIEYPEYLPESALDDPSGWLASSVGRVDLLGFPNGEARYTQVAFETTDRIFIGVRPVYPKLNPIPTWNLTDAIESWSWSGREGCKAQVEVYARAESVELLLNGRSLGRRRPGHGCRVVFHVPYEGGTLSARAYDKVGNVLAETSLTTADDSTELRVLPENEQPGSDGLVFVPIIYTDKAGVWKPMEHHRLHIEVQGGKLLAFGSAQPYVTERYRSADTESYYGRAMAVVRAEGGAPLDIRVHDGERFVSVTLPTV